MKSIPVTFKFFIIFIFLLKDNFAYQRKKKYFKSNKLIVSALEENLKFLKQNIEDEYFLNIIESQIIVKELGKYLEKKLVEFGKIIKH
jgi:hypothetical protein